MNVDVEAMHAVHGTLGDLSPVFRGSASRWLPEPVRHVGPKRWRFELRVGPAHHTVVAEVGTLWSSSDGDSRSVHWWASTDPGDPTRASRLYPEFDGHVSLHATGDGQQVEVKGHYRPPAGLVGAALDAAGLHLVAQATVTRLAEMIAARLEHALVIVPSD